MSAGGKVGGSRSGKWDCKVGKDFVPAYRAAAKEAAMAVHRCDRTLMVADGELDAFEHCPSNLQC